jgi:hypothetical protein
VLGLKRKVALPGEGIFPVPRRTHEYPCCLDVPASSYPLHGNVQQQSVRPIVAG